jgi:hypothetical protein
MMLAGAAQAWEYWNTGSPNIVGQTAPRDNLTELFGPRLDRIQIQMFAGVGPARAPSKSRTFSRV